MSGPAYPPLPRAGDNAIGRYVIGVSPIGDQPDFVVDDTVAAQYANSDTLVGILRSFAEAIDQRIPLQSLFDTVWNMDTAVGFGLDILGRIVGVTRALHVTNVGKYLGWQEAGSISADPWGQSPWYAGLPLTSNFNLTDDAFRRLIFAKALSNISNGSTADINAILRVLFAGRGNAWVADNRDMSLTYKFSFSLTDVDAAMLFQTGVLPKPAGVSQSIQFNVAG